MFEGLPPDSSSTNTSRSDTTHKQARTAGSIAAGVIVALAIAGYVAFLILRPRVAPKSPSPSETPEISEIPDTQIPLYYMPEMPQNSPPAWELSANLEHSGALRGASVREVSV